MCLREYCSTPCCCSTHAEAHKYFLNTGERAWQHVLSLTQRWLGHAGIATATHYTPRCKHTHTHVHTNTHTYVQRIHCAMHDHVDEFATVRANQVSTTTAVQSVFHVPPRSKTRGHWKTHSGWFVYMWARLVERVGLGFGPFVNGGNVSVYRVSCVSVCTCADKQTH